MKPGKMHHLVRFFASLAFLAEGILFLLCSYDQVRIYLIDFEYSSIITTALETTVIGILFIGAAYLLFRDKFSYGSKLFLASSVASLFIVFIIIIKYTQTLLVYLMNVFFSGVQITSISKAPSAPLVWTVHLFCLLAIILLIIASLIATIKRARAQKAESN